MNRGRANLQPIYKAEQAITSSPDQTATLNSPVKLKQSFPNIQPSETLETILQHPSQP